MRPRSFAGFNFIRDSQHQIFESRGCTRTETVEQRYDQKEHRKYIQLKLRSKGELQFTMFLILEFINC